MTVGIGELLLLWGKTEKDAIQSVVSTHPLLCHMIDVGAVTEAIWSRCLTEWVRQNVATRLSCEQGAVGRTLAFWASLHDLGKASPAFQSMHTESVAPLKASGMRFPRRHQKVYHGQVTGATLGDILKENGLAPGLAYVVSQSLAGHHGSWPTAMALYNLSAAQVGAGRWHEARRAIGEALRDVFQPELSLPDPDDVAQAYLGAWLSGLVSAADWVGSMTDFFKPAPETSDLSAYLVQAREQAVEAIHALQWDAWSPSSQPATFETLFEGWTPNAIQQAAIAAAQHWHEPGLAILEAPTGSGKTEAALYLADLWASSCQQRGLYVAMPTMATSNQMHSRALKMIQARYGGEIEPLLVHSQARWREQPWRMRVAHDEDPRQSYEAMSWFLPRKRSLLAPLGVGTVDQALMCVLQTRHFFVRLFGLAHKTIIFDEVHAYDSYMSALFERLLLWLRGLGCSVVILSATLPRRTRDRLLAAFGGQTDVLDDRASYPSLSWVNGGQTRSQALPAPEDHALALDWLAPEPVGIADALADALSEGGCAAVICNTVARAQEVYRVLKERKLVAGDEDLTLFHARFPAWRREEIEQEVLKRFGKEVHGQRHGIVVATQVIEQSLDLDFDLMISDMAPIDLLIQRAGRLHRHERPARPAPLATPKLCIACEAPDGPLPGFADNYIYAQYVMLRSWLTLQGREQLSLPGELRGLIESVYGDDPPPGADDPGVAARLEAARAKLDKEDRGEIFSARNCLIPLPDDDNVLAFHSMALSEEDPGQHEALQAHTRNGPPSITLVCLHKTEDGLVLEPYQHQPVDVMQMPNREQTRELVRHSISVSLRRVYHCFSGREVPAGWARHPLLRYDRLAVFADGRCEMDDGWYLTLDDAYGLQLLKEDDGCPIPTT